MKAYNFRFENVLRSKKIIVDQLESKVARAKKILMMEEKKLENIEERKDQCIQELMLRQIGIVDADEIHRCHRYLEQLDGAIIEQRNMVKEISRRVEMLLAMLIGAEKDRKVFEKLDEKERQKFQQSFMKKEQALLDEVGVNAFIRRDAHNQAHSPQQR